MTLCHLPPTEAWCISLHLQVLEWIKNPVTADQYERNCTTPTDMWFPSGHYCKAVSCVNGGWGVGGIG